MRRAFAALALTISAMLAPVALAHGAESKGVEISHPWVRATPGGSTLTAAFLEIKSEKGDKLIGAKSPVAGRAEVHTHIMDGNVMKMRRVEAIEIAQGASRIFKPMGDHIMLLDLKQPLKEGDLVKLTLTFEKAGDIEVDATVEPVGAMGPHGLDQQPKTDEKSGADSHPHEGH